MKKFFALILGMGCFLGLVSGIAPLSFGQISLLESEQQAFKQAADFASRSVVQIETFAGLDAVGGDQNANSTFTGTLVDPQGWIITSLFHLRSQAASVTVVFANKERVAAKIVAKDFSRELVLLKVEDAASTSVGLVSPASEWKIGQWVVALGKTFDATSASRSVGILSAEGRAFDKAFQIDAKVSPLNYGGPVIDLNGRIMGILTPINPNIATEGEVQQWYDSGVAFAVPYRDILDRLPTLMEGKDLYPGKIGIRPKSRDDFGGPVTLAGVSPGSPAAKAGLRAGDTIQRVNGKPIEQMNQLRHALGPVDAGQSIDLEYERGGITKSTKCELVKEIPLYREPYLGLLLEPSADESNLSIAAIIPGSPAEKSGLKVGQSIQRIDGETIENRNKLREVLAFADYRSKSRFRLLEGDSQTPSEVTVEAGLLPKEIPADFPILKNATTAKDGKGAFDIPLADVTNKAFAFVPPNYSKDVPHGLLVVLPEAGPIDRKEWIDAYEPFCREHRWILASLTAADPKQWSLEESDLVQRIMRQIELDYAIDSRRIAIGGFGTGGTLALVTAMQEKSKVRGLYLIESKLPMSGRFQAAEPMETIHWLLIGGRKEFPKFTEALNKMGYPVALIDQAIEVGKPQHAIYAPLLQRWLRRLEAY